MPGAPLPAKGDGSRITAKRATGQHVSESEFVRKEICADAWLTDQVIPAYDRLKADPSRSRSIEDVRASLAALEIDGTPSR